MVSKKKSNWKLVTLSAVLVGSIVGSVIYLLVESKQPHQYICHIEGYDPDSNVLAMKCLHR